MPIGAPPGNRLIDELDLEIYNSECISRCISRYIDRDILIEVNFVEIDPELFLELREVEESDTLVRWRLSG